MVPAYEQATLLAFYKSAPKNTFPQDVFYIQLPQLLFKVLLKDSDSGNAYISNCWAYF